ncbi:BppU family phage baseplate upper protein [Listeria booriae]|uniref:BppU family phage baseplate upper protein n=1 Tax=Listeria booriae TaxID=1552123 RepID=UPI001626047F|nr:BppU family phage baseplate upper protein [Listeria booriae]MBC2389081.1 BppU family phage baseplate upper protein [Listeria booriae]
MNENVYKELGATLQVSSLNSAPVTLNGSFSTQDKNTARLSFRMKGDNLQLDTVEACVYLSSKTLKSEATATIDTAYNTVSYVLSDEEISHAGNIDGELYLRYPNGQILSAHRFRFKIDRALIDQNVEIVEAVYNTTIERLMQEYRDKFNNLDIESERQLAEIASKLNTAQASADATRVEVEGYKKTFEDNQALNKSGDTATGSLNNTAEAAFNVSLGYLRHYIGAQTENTIVRVYLGYVGHWGNYVDVTVGATTPVIGENFFIDPITPTTTYLTGGAPLDVTRTKTVINGVEKAASNTVSMKNLIEMGRKNGAPYFKGNAEYDGSLTFDVAKTASTLFYDLNNIGETQSWGRGFGTRTNVRTAEIGISGVGKAANSIYLGFDTAPWTKTSGVFIEKSTKKVFAFNEEMETVKGALAKVDAFKKSMNAPHIPLTLKNGFTAKNSSLVGYLAIPLGNRYLIWLKGWINANTGIIGTMPTAFLPDEVFQAAFSGAQQSDVSVNPTSGNIEVTAIGNATTAISLASVIYITKEVVS